jgi:epidermal growth factor receptor substrate 15
VEPPAVQESHPGVEDGKVSSNGASTEKEDNKSDKTAAEQKIEPEVTGSDSKAELAKAPPVSPAKKANDGHSDEPDKKQSGTNDDSPRSTRYNFVSLSILYMNYTPVSLAKKTDKCASSMTKHPMF